MVRFCSLVAFSGLLLACSTGSSGGPEDAGVAGQSGGAGNTGTAGSTSAAGTSSGGTEADGGRGGAAGKGGGAAGEGGAESPGGQAGSAGDAGAAGATASGGAAGEGGGGACTLVAKYSSKDAFCNACAESKCCAEVNGCLGDTRCNDDYVNCQLACALLPDDEDPAAIKACFAQCGVDYPEGKKLYDAAIGCVDTKCAGICE